MCSYENMSELDTMMEEYENINDASFESINDTDYVDDILSDMNVEELSYIRDELENGNQDMMDFFGVGDDVSDDSGEDQKVLSLF